MLIGNCIFIFHQSILGFNKLKLTKILIGLFLLIITCCSDNISDSENIFFAKPVVKKTYSNYTKDSFTNSFPDNSSLQFISNAYTNNFNENIRIQLLDYMKEEVSKLGEDVSIFEKILNKAHCYDKEGYLLPTYAERAKYENKEVWILQTAQGLSEPVFSHYKCFVFGILG
jgi:hypothetical protein